MSGGSTARALAFASVVWIGWHEVLLVVDELILSHVLAPFGGFDLRRDVPEQRRALVLPRGLGTSVSAKVSRYWDYRERGRVANLPAAHPRRKCYSSLPSTASVVSSLLGISRVSWTKHPESR